MNNWLIFDNLAINLNQCSYIKQLDNGRTELKIVNGDCLEIDISYKIIKDLLIKEQNTNYCVNK